MIIKNWINLVTCVTLSITLQCQNNAKVVDNQIVTKAAVQEDIKNDSAAIDTTNEQNIIQNLNWRQFLKERTYRQNGVIFNILRDTSKQGNIRFYVIQMIDKGFNDSIFEFEKGHDVDLIQKDFNNDGFYDFKEHKSPLRQPWFYIFDLETKTFHGNLLRGEIREVEKGIFCDFPTHNKQGADPISNLFYFKQGKAVLLGEIVIHNENSYMDIGSNYQFADVYKIESKKTEWKERIDQKLFNRYFKNGQTEEYYAFFIDFWRKNVRRFENK